MTDDGVPRAFEFSFLVGEVVRNDVFVETETRVLWQTLSTAGVAPGSLQRDYGRLLPAVRKAMRSPIIPSSLRDIAVPVVQAALDAHRERNALVHDQWIEVPWSPGEVRALRRPQRRQLAELQTLSAQLLNLTWQMRGVAIITPAWLGQESEPADADDLHEWTRVAMGNIADDNKRVRGTAGPAPLPPGYDAR